MDKLEKAKQAIDKFVECVNKAHEEMVQTLESVGGGGSGGDPDDD